MVVLGSPRFSTSLQKPPSMPPLTRVLSERHVHVPTQGNFDVLVLKDTVLCGEREGRRGKKYEYSKFPFHGVLLESRAEVE
jgi:hypothetical protein